jgi:hypothetical protein
MAKTKELKPALKAGILYLGDNGRCFCVKHAGMTALYTGRDISGQRVLALTDLALAAMAKEIGRDMKCEDCAAIARNGTR